MSGALTPLRRVGYGIGDIGFNLFFTTASLYLLFFYTEAMGLPPATAGWIFAVALVWDAVTDPVMGYLASRTRSRWGRYRPWLLFGTVPLAASWVLMFVPTGLAGLSLTLFALATHMLFRTLYTVVSMPYLSLSAAMTADSNERGLLASIRMLSATAAGLFIAFFTLKLVAAFGGGDARTGWLWVAILYSALSCLILFTTFAATREDTDIDEGPLPTIADMIRMLRANGAFWLIACWLLMGSIASTLFGKTLPYWFKYGLNDEAGIGPALATITATAMLGIPLWTLVMRRTSKRFITIAGGLVGMVGYTGFFLGSTGAPLYAALAVMGLGAGAGYLAFWAMVPDTVELGAFRTGVRAEGMIFGVISFVQKAALGISVGLLGELLAAIGYVANRPQSADTLLAMERLMLWGPIGCGLAGLALIARYPLDRRLHGRLVRALAWRRIRTSSPSAPPPA
ncbi:MFS transporter [Sandaracinobacteroides saxicola]|uniref:MFS transporter n=1 Tax=Sandaracinobacteroides saxicola TaxID=2759707 RepID=A0A7G5IHF7_9SPHN|nr:glycoside-pentoside-hexuronide (GPH):cation symporter [Sandaracinobacteroides saxicola]QMW22799.1 MFS transporter [Sandaracinobacteroides saxicola]